MEAEEIIRALAADLEIDPEDISETSTSFYRAMAFESSSKGNNGEKEWIVFEDQDDAEAAAIKYVEDMISDEPEVFSPDFLQQHVYITDTDKRVFAGEEADARAESMDVDELLKYLGKDADKEDLEETISDLEDQISELEGKDQPEDLEAAQEALKDAEGQLELLTDENDLRSEASGQMADEIEDDLLDPIQYFVHDQGIYANAGEMLKAGILHIDYSAAAQEAVNVDGIAHFLDNYDGSEEDITDPETKHTFVAYGTN